MDHEDSVWHARIPADIDRPEPVLWNLTARQLLLLTPAALTTWALFSPLAGFLPLWASVGVSALVLALSWVLALGRRDGIGLDRLAALSLLWLLHAKHRAPATPRVRLPRWAPRAARGPRLAPLNLPVSAVGGEGTVDLGQRCAVVLTCSTVPFHLASGQEQDQILASFAAFLDSLTEPAQFVVQRRRTDLDAHIRGTRDRARTLPHPRLRRAALAHGAFLDDLQRRHQLVHHQVLLVLTAEGPVREVGEALLWRAEDAVSQLAALGVRARLCEGPAAERVLRSSLNPGSGTRPLTTTQEER
ncbi:PrgI family protein [Nocardiopsis synnemataformans]|uniref:PrgI family protein n=1 Tax=Nocardiopsis synnemataformans TaxID=61305 RepID=UPI003EB93BC1